MNKTCQHTHCIALGTIIGLCPAHYQDSWRVRHITMCEAYKCRRDAEDGKQYCEFHLVKEAQFGHADYKIPRKDCIVPSCAARHTQRGSMCSKCSRQLSRMPHTEPAWKRIVNMDAKLEAEKSKKLNLFSEYSYL